MSKILITGGAGYPAVLISNNTKIKARMNWNPEYDDLELICKSAYVWESNCF